MPAYATRSLALPSATSNVTDLSPHTSEPGCTRPPRRKRWPGAICCSAAIDGVEKNTIELRKPYSTSPAAKASTASAHPIMVKRRCLRVMLVSAVGASARSSVKPHALEAFIELPQPLGTVGDGSPRTGDGGLCLVVIAQHRIGPHQLQPSLDVVAILLQPARETLDHAADHRAAVTLAHILGRSHCLFRKCRRLGPADPAEGVLHQRTPRRFRGRLIEHGLPDRGGIAAAAVLLGREPKEIARLDLSRIERQRTIELASGVLG